MIKIKRNKLNSKGFTLGEVLIVLAIMAILFGIGMVALINYVNNMKLLEMDTTARQIFVAAQNHLTAADATGKADTYVKANSSGEALGSPLQEKPSDWDDAGMPEWDKVKGNYRYFIYTPSAERSNELLENSMLKYMLPFGAIDDTVRTECSYVIEYNIKTASVYGVFYTDKAELSDADIKAMNTAGGGRYNTTEGRKVRRDYVNAAGNHYTIGYYGGAMINDLAVDKIAAPTLKIENKDTLTAVVTDPNYFKTSGTSQVKSYINLTVKGIESNNEKTLQMVLNATGTTPTKKDANEKWWDVKVTGTGANQVLTYSIRLDDITTPGGHFYDLFCNEKDKAKNLIPGEDIIVTATCSSNNILTTFETSNEAKCNSLFGDKTSVLGTDKMAEVQYLRHVENLDTTVSGLPILIDKVAAPAVNSVVTAVNQTKDMDWKEFFEPDGGEKKSVYAKGGSANSLPIAKESYFGISSTTVGLYEGNGQTVRNIYINNQAKSGGNLSLNAGFFSILDRNGKSFEIKDLILKDFDVNATRNAAVLFGETSGTLTKVTISNVLVDGGAVKSTGGGNAGTNAAGMFGYCSANNLTVSNCAASAKTLNTGNTIGNTGVEQYMNRAAGFAGRTKCTTANFENCYAGGHTEDGKYNENDCNVTANSGYAGGFLGDIGSGSNATFTNCFSTCSVSGAYGGGFVGGIVYNGKVTFNNCYSTGLVKGSLGAGSFGGSWSAGTVTATGSCYLDQSNDGLGDFGGNKGAVTGISEKTYDDMKAMAKETVDTHNFDSYLNQQDYPFAAVANVGLTTGSSKTYSYYGDWTVENVQLSSRSFAYREKINGKDKWYIVSASSDDNKTVTIKESQNDLKGTGKSTYVDDDTSYGFLSTKEFDTGKNGDFPGGQIDSWLPYAGEVVIIGGETYYYYKIKVPSGEQELATGRVKTPEWKMFDKGSGNVRVSFTFNPDFAGAIECTDQSGELGSTANSYQIRTNKQLRSINNNEKYYEKSFRQTCDIKLSDYYFDPIGKNVGFSGSYDAEDKGNLPYSISNLRMVNNENDTYFGIFGIVAKAGIVRNLNVTDVNEFIADKNAENIGLIAGMCRGTIENCTAEGNIKTYNRTSYGSIGGIVGILDEKGSIFASSFDGSIEESNSSNYYSDIGGIAGCMTSSGSIDGCTSNADITSNRYGNTGGLIGTMEIGTVSDSNVTSNVEIVSTSNKETIGGFVGRMTGTSPKVLSCHSQATIKDSSGGSNVGGFVGSIGSGGIEKCSYYGSIDTNNAINVGGFAGTYSGGTSIDQCYSKGSISANNVTYAGGFVGVKSENYKLSNSYAAINFKSVTGNNSKVGMFVAEADNDSGMYTCHAVELNGSYALTIANRYDFIYKKLVVNTIGDDNNRCYALHNKGILGSSIKGVYYINDFNEYNKLSSFVNFKDSIWEIGTQGYPILKNNKEEDLKYPGTTISIQPNYWPKQEEYVNASDNITVYAGGIFQYTDGKYYVVVKDTGLTKAQALSGPSGDAYNWFATAKITGKIITDLNDSSQKTDMARGDMCLYKGEYFVFIDGGPVASSPGKTPLQWYKIPFQK